MVECIIMHKYSPVQLGNRNHNFPNQLMSYDLIEQWNVRLSDMYYTGAESLKTMFFLSATLLLFLPEGHYHGA